MKTIKNSNGKKTLIFVLEYESITGGMLHSVTSLISEIYNKYHVMVICPKGELACFMKELSITTIEIGNNTLWHSKDIFKRVSLIRKIHCAIKQSLNPSAIVVTNNIYAQLLVSICSYFSKFRLVYFNRGGELNNTISKLVIVLSHKLNLVICTSTNQRKIVRRSGLLRNGAQSVTLFNPVALNNQERFSVPEKHQSKPFIIGIVGYIDYGKNQLLAIDALAELRSKKFNVEIHLYGEANNSEYLTKLRKRIVEHSLEKYVKFKGFISDKTYVYQNINLLLSTSIAEGFGRTLVEAMLAKRPVVALSIAGGPADIIISSEYGQLVENDPSSVAKALELFISNESYKNEVIRRAFYFAHDNFNPAAIAANFVSILEREIK